MGTLETCPLCGAKMEKGFVTTARTIYWSEKETNSWTRAGDENLAGSRWSGTCIAAYRCPKCKIVIFSYKQE
jgi:hypothetical protein